MLVLPSWERVKMPWCSAAAEADGYLSPAEEGEEGGEEGGAEGGAPGVEGMGGAAVAMGAERLGAAVGSFAGRMMPMVGGAVASKLGSQLGAEVGKSVARQKPEVRRAGAAERACRACRACQACPAQPASQPASAPASERTNVASQQRCKDAKTAFH